MKWLAFVLFLSFSTPGLAAKRAVVIGVAGYPENADLAGAPKDADAWEKVLQTRFEFPKENIRKLNKPSNTNRKSIMDALSKLAGETREGDVIFISFSGHGTWREDQDKEEEADGRDEALVANEGLKDGVILDDDLNRSLRAILESPRGKPANVTLVIDSCNAGGSAKGAWKPRWYPGTPEISTVGEKPQKSGACTSSPNDDFWVTPGGVLDCFYASRSGVAAADLGYAGAFTRALVEVAVPGKLCSQVDREAKARVQTRQQPYGEYSDRPFLGTERAGFPTFRLHTVTGKTAKLDAGEIQGMLPGTRLAVYQETEQLTEAESLQPPSAPRRLAVVRVTAASPDESDVELEGAGRLVERGKVLVVERRYDLRVPVLVELNGAPNAAAFLTDLQKSSVVRAVTGSEKRLLWLKRERKEQEWVWKICDPASGTVFPLSRMVDGKAQPDWAVFPEADVEEARMALETYAQMMNLRLLQNRDWESAKSQVSVRVEVLEAFQDGDGTERLEPAKKGTEGEWILTKDRGLRFRLYNEPQEPLTEITQGRYKYHFGILDLAPDGKVTYLGPPVPDGERDPTDNLLLPKAPGTGALITGSFPEYSLGSVSVSRDTEYFLFVISRNHTPLKPLQQRGVLLMPRGARGKGDDPRPSHDALDKFSKGVQAKPLEWFTLLIPYRVIEPPK